MADLCRIELPVGRQPLRLLQAADGFLGIPDEGVPLEAGDRLVVLQSTGQVAERLITPRDLEERVGPAFVVLFVFEEAVEGVFGLAQFIEVELAKQFGSKVPGFLFAAGAFIAFVEDVFEKLNAFGTLAAAEQDAGLN